MTTPAKFKAYLGNLKETALDSDSLNTKQSFQPLLAAELVQRGVLFDVNDGAADKLLDAIISTAGKPLLDDSSSALPKPLIAAASAMAGMIAESCAALGTTEKAAVNSSSIQTALTRCKDVHDNRLSGLLNLLVTTEEEKSDMLLTVAEGYFLRAALIQPDSPQMWKRCLDVLERQQSDESIVLFEAGLPLSRLISIASKKGNEKRVSELSLKLAESYLSPQQTPSSNLQEELHKSFVTPFRPCKTLSESDCVKKAQQALDRVSIDLIKDDGESLLWEKLLNCRIEWATEQTKMDDLGSEKVSTAKNRGTSASNEACRTSARSEVLIESFRNGSLKKSAIELRDLILSGNLTKLNPRESSAVKLLRHQSERLVDRAQAVSLASQLKKSSCTEQQAGAAWHEVSEFTRPIVHRVRDLSMWDASMSLNEREKLISELFLVLPSQSLMMTQSALLASSCWAWMTSNQDTYDEDLQDLELCLDTLSVLLRMEHENERLSQEDDVLKSSENEEGSVLELECAHATILSLVGLARVGVPSGKSNLLTHEATRKATGMAEKFDKYESQQGKYGSAYMLLLMAWSGLHRGPWPFCNVTQARAIIRGARAAKSSASTTWARNETALESLLLDISEADAEGGTLTGGFEKKAEGLYKKSLQQAEAGMDSVSACVLPLLRSHCLNGLARLSLHGKYAEETSGPITAKEQAEKALADVILVRNNDSVPFYLWKAQDSSGSSALFHVNVSRQLIADSLVRASRPGDAQVFLEDAVRDSPADFDAMFALGSFRLRMALYESVDASPEEQKLAQTQLLKSAKIDSGKPGPFALLGIWYEVQNDLKRAVGCYSKCLLLDPSNPVAGRGLLRLKSPTEAQKLCEAATKSNSPVNGWAWQAMGVEKSMKENDNDLAIVCFLQALRCRDIECPQNEPFSIFFTLPNLAGLTSELSHVWAELAGCYRRVGRYAAAARAFQSAWQVEEEKLASQVLCSWAQVELELGLFEEATEKFDLVLQREKDPSRTIAAYGQGSALLSLGRRDALDGKAAAAIQHVSRAISSIENIFLREGVASPPAGCALELLGLLYSFGALLPPDVFLEVADDGSHVDEQSMLKAQASFVANGEKAYRDAADSLIASDEDEIHALRAAMLCDLGSNILLQGQIMSSAYGVAQGCTPDLTLRDVIEMNSEVKSMYDRSIDVFKDAISVSPLHGPAWCGLGCSLSVTDPLLAQHALCTALTVDKMMPDSWSNLAFLFAEKDANAQSAEMLDGLTQVADSPLMWICRALLLEREVQLDSGPCEPLISRAADAYRAALQVVKHPSALLGLSLTCRATVSTTPVSNEEKTSMYGSISSDLARRDSYGYMSEYVGLSSGTNLGSCVLGSVMTLEHAVVAVKTKPLGLDQVLKSEAIEEAYVNISKGIEGLERLSSPSSVLDSVRGVDVDPIKDVVGRVSSLASNTEDTADVSTETDPFEHRLTPSRRIIHDPETGIAWLDLAKSLAKELLSVSDSKKKKVVKEVLESATRASDCAARILSNQVSDPVKVRSPPHVVSNDSEEEVVMSVAVVPAIVDARDVSEALALSYWIETIEMYIVDVEGDERSPKRALDLQRALLMDPSNAFAREALQRTIPTT